MKRKPKITAYQLRKAKFAVARDSAMTLEEYLNTLRDTSYKDFIGRTVRWTGADHEIRNAKYYHQSRVAWAIYFGMDVPANVLEQYPNIADDVARIREANGGA